MRRALCVSIALWASSCNLLFPFNTDQVCESRIRAACHFAFSCCNATERLANVLARGFRNEGDCIEEGLRETGSCANADAVVEATQQGRFR